MAWLKIDDQFYANQKAVRAFTTDPAALGVWLMCATWSANQMTDGHIPEHLTRMWGVEQGPIDVLVGCGLWLEDAASEGWVMNDFLDYNPSRAELIEKREKESARKARGRGADSARTRSGIRADVNGPVPVPEPVTSLRDVNTRGISPKEARTRKRLGLEAEGPGGTAA